jgi:divalent metal cation (Fe/Co/Zn/Cd) transporter
MTTLAVLDRRAVVRRGRRLTWATIAYNCLEAVLAIGAGVVAGSVALVGFGFDSVIEVGSSIAGLWLNAAFGWWWADPVAALLMVPLIAWEGLQAVRGRTVCADCCSPVDVAG